MKPSNVSVEINVHQTDGQSGHRVLVDFEFKNSGPRKERIEKWLALDPPVVTLALLRVFRADGTPIRYTGRHFHRRPPTTEDYLVLSPGQSLSVKGVDVTAVYDWPATEQTLSVKYEAFTAAYGGLALVQSASKELRYVPTVK